jgi:hypothetical protein
MGQDGAEWGRKLQAWLGTRLTKFWEKLSQLLPVILTRQKQATALRVAKMISTKSVITLIFLALLLREACNIRI